MVRFSLIHLYEDRRSLSEDILEMEKADIQNMYHAQTIGQHARFTQKLLEERLPELTAGYRVGAYLHDIGKLYLMQRNSGPMPHYMGHGNVGAYYLMCMEKQIKQIYGLTETEFYDMLFLVNYHMQPFVWEKTKNGESKAKAADMVRFRKEQMEILAEFSQCDMARPMSK